MLIIQNGYCVRTLTSHHFFFLTVFAAWSFCFVLLIDTLREISHCHKADSLMGKTSFFAQMCVFILSRIWGYLNSWYPKAQKEGDGRPPSEVRSQVHTKSIESPSHYLPLPSSSSLSFLILLPKSWNFKKWTLRIFWTNSTNNFIWHMQMSSLLRLI